MKDPANPYQPPVETYEESPPWGDWFWSFFRRASDYANFLHGEPVIHYGVVFFLQPGEDDFFHAALPLSEATQEQIKRNVNEVLRVLPEFLDDNPRLRPHAAKRSLMIRGIASYQDLDHELCVRVITNKHRKPG